MRIRIATVRRAWEDYLDEQPAGWLVEGEAPDFDKTWAFIRDGMINSRRTRSLRIEGLEGKLEQSVQSYVNTMRDWLWPELFPSMTTRGDGMSVGEWRSFWSRLKTRVNAAFSDGGQMSLGRHVQAQAAAASEASGASASTAGDAGLSAGRAAVRHRRSQTQTPGTRDHASETDLYMAQVCVANERAHGQRW
jgi:hypothetical protein